MDVTFLGVGAALNSSSQKTAFLIGDKVLIDAGADPTSALRRHGTDPNSIEYVFISHLHGDHYFGLTFLIAESFLLRNERKPLSVYGPPGVRDAVTQLLMLAYPVTPAESFLARAKVNFTEVEPGDQLSTEHLTVRVLAASHGKMVANSFIVTSKGDPISVFFGCDTELTQDTLTAISGANYSVLNFPLRDQKLPAHGSLVELLEARAKGIIEESWTFCCHRTDWTGDAAAGKLIFPNDGDSYRLALECPQQI